MGMDSLLQYGVYEARCLGSLLGRISKYDNQRDPTVEIKGPDGWRYSGSVIFSTNKIWGEESNRVRQRLIDGLPVDDLRVKVLSSPESMGSRASYATVATKEALGPLQIVRKTAKERMSEVGRHTFEEASEVLLAMDLTWAKCVNMGKVDPAVVGYDAGGRKMFGYLVPSYEVQKFPSRRMFAEERIVPELKPINVGEMVLVRVARQSDSTGSALFFFNRVLTFLDRDFVNDPKGRPLVTRGVDDSGSEFSRPYREGDVICDLPVVETFSPKKFIGRYGLGFVQRPDGEELSNFHYKRVWIENSDGQVYVPRAKVTRITGRTGDLLIARAE